MREKKLDQLASLDVYAGGASAGLTNKISPPSQVFTDGARPGDAYGAQWKNYVDYYLQRQIECSAQLPFRNFTEIAAVPALTSTPRFAFNRLNGTTLIANSVNNSPKYIQEFLEASSGAPLGITLSPAVGTFVPRDCVYVPSFLGWVVVGSNSGATTKTIFEISQGGVGTETVSPATGAVEIACYDSVSGKVYAFVSDTNRSVLQRSAAGAWSVLGTRGAGAPAPVQTAFCAANNDVIIYSDSTSFPTVEKITTGTFVRTTHSLSGTDTTAVADCRYSPQLQAFMVLTQRNWYVFADPAGTIQTFSALSPTGNLATGGCLTETGAVGFRNNVSESLLYVRTWPGDPLFVLKFGDHAGGSQGDYVRYDGSAIWFQIDKSGAKRLFRSLRSN